MRITSAADVSTGRDEHPVNPIRWDALMRETARLLKRFKDDGQFQLEEVYSSLAPFYSASDIDPDFIKFIEDPIGYTEVLEMSEAGVTQRAFLEYMNS